MGLQAAVRELMPGARGLGGDCGEEVGFFWGGEEGGEVVGCGGEVGEGAEGQGEVEGGGGGGGSGHFGG